MTFDRRQPLMEIAPKEDHFRFHIAIPLGGLSLLLCSIAVIVALCRIALPFDVLIFSYVVSTWINQCSSYNAGDYCCC